MDVEGSPTEPATIRATWTADINGPAYIAVSASDNHDYKPREPYKPKYPKPSPYTLKVKVEGETTETGESSPSIARVKTAGGAGFSAAAELKPPTLATSDLKIGETAFFKFPGKKGDVVQAAGAVQKPWYNSSNTASKATYTLTLYDDDQVQVTQKKVDVAMNPPDAQTLEVTWPATVSGNAYLSVGAANSGGDNCRGNFPPHARPPSVQVASQCGSIP